MVVWSVAGMAVADDVLPPDWRGDSNTVRAAWDIWGPPGPGPGTSILFGNQVTTNPPDAFNPLAAAATAHWDGSCSIIANVAGRSNVLYVPPGGPPGVVWFDLLNFPDDNVEKRIRLQITFQGAGVMDFYVTTPGALETHYDALVAEGLTHPDGWTTSAYDIVIEPNPPWEQIELDWGYANPDGCYIDQVVIDTQCPEPATLSLLAVSGILLLKRRRKPTA
jgi:hypothetical protein